MFLYFTGGFLPKQYSTTKILGPELKVTSPVHTGQDYNTVNYKGQFTHSMPCPCGAHVVPLPCRAAKGLECVFPYDLHIAAVSDSHLPYHAPTMPFFSRPQPCCAVALRRTTWSKHGMASVNQTRPHCVNQMGKTRSKPLAARHGRGTAWARHAMCESALKSPLNRLV